MHAIHVTLLALVIAHEVSQCKAHLQNVSQPVHKHGTELVPVQAAPLAYYAFELFAALVG